MFVSGGCQVVVLTSDFSPPYFKKKFIIMKFIIKEQIDKFSNGEVEISYFVAIKHEGESLNTYFSCHSTLEEAKAEVEKIKDIYPSKNIRQVQLPDNLPKHYKVEIETILARWENYLVKDICCVYKNGNFICFKDSVLEAIEFIESDIDDDKKVNTSKIVFEIKIHKNMEVTLEKLKEISAESGVLTAIGWATNQIEDAPIRPKKPILNFKNTSSKDAKEYAIELEDWEAQMEIHQEKLSDYVQKRNDIEKAITEYIKYEAGIDLVPEQYREKVWSKAWSDGHSSGFYEVYLQLNSLIEIFE